ncbi:MAG: RuBisCO large subunit C-terminal-like domain-containing protein [Nanoarchaeota archaeon]|nr:RuBisCO large subunit C-terminal-like domain-containing protein [Nanoarchaeota archaeon]
MEKEKLKSFFRQTIDPEQHIITINIVKAKAGVDINALAEMISAEESVGSEAVFRGKESKYYTPAEETDEIRDQYAGKITRVEPAEDGYYWIDIAYPLVNICQFTPNIPILLTMIFGDHNGLSEVESCRLDDVIFPKEFLKDFKGPRFGVEGIRNIVGVKDKPLVGAIIKPNIGNSPERTAEICKELVSNGINFIKDDEILVDVPICRLKDRIQHVSKVIGKNVIWASNITTPTDRIRETAKFAIENGANCLMVNFLATGYDALRTLREDDSINVPIHTHRCGHDIFTRDPKNGVSMRVFAKLARISGADFVHIGNVSGDKTQAQVQDIKNTYDALLEPMHHIKPTMPVSTRLVADEMARSYKTLGKDIVLAGCGGIYRHPMGKGAGVRSLVQAVEYLDSMPENPKEEFIRAKEI